MLAYDSPHRFVITWNISLEWQLEADTTKVSEIEVTFLPESPTTTRVELTHRHLDRHGPGWEQMRDAVGSPDGWQRGLARFTAQAAAPLSRPARGYLRASAASSPPKFALDMTDQVREDRATHDALVVHDRFRTDSDLWTSWTEPARGDLLCESEDEEELRAFAGRIPLSQYESPPLISGRCLRDSYGKADRPATRAPGFDEPRIAHVPV